jgi:hypothetical protein
MSRFHVFRSNSNHSDIVSSLKSFAASGVRASDSNSIRHLNRRVSDLVEGRSHRESVGLAIERVWASFEGVLFSGFTFKHPDGDFLVDHLLVNKLGNVMVFQCANFASGESVSVGKDGAWRVSDEEGAYTIASPLVAARVLREKLTWVLSGACEVDLPFEVDENTVTVAVVIPDRVQFSSDLRKVPVLHVGELGNEKRLREIRSEQFVFAGGTFDPEKAHEVLALRDHIQIFGSFVTGDASHYASLLAGATAALQALVTEPTADFYVRESLADDTSVASGMDRQALPVSALSDMAVAA